LAPGAVFRGGNCHVARGTGEADHRASFGIAVESCQDWRVLMRSKLVTFSEKNRRLDRFIVWQYQFTRNLFSVASPMTGVQLKLWWEIEGHSVTFSPPTFPGYLSGRGTIKSENCN
jgi:hypothetical protein